MKDTQPIIIEGVTQKLPAKKKHTSGWRIFLYVLLGLALLLALLYLVWIRPALQKPISEPLILPTMVVGPVEGEGVAAATINLLPTSRRCRCSLNRPRKQARSPFAEMKLPGLCCWSASIIVIHNTPTGWRM